jgi:hypothetical protein
MGWSGGLREPLARLGVEARPGGISHRDAAAAIQEKLRDDLDVPLEGLREDLAVDLRSRVAQLEEWIEYLPLGDLDLERLLGGAHRPRRSRDSTRPVSART